MDLTVIRVKRALDAEPLEQIGLSSKKLKNLDGTATLCMVTTLQSKVTGYMIVINIFY